jgi:dTDP-4-amino-4,6-dideoxygalactose transaminase
VKDFVPVNEPLLDGNEKRYLGECIDTGWISSEGPFVRRFEEEFAAHVGRKHGVAVCNGSAALDASLRHSALPLHDHFARFRHFAGRRGALTACPWIWIQFLHLPLIMA